MNAVKRIQKKHKSFVCIGKVGKAYGYRGAFFVRDRKEKIPENYLEVFFEDALDAPHRIIESGKTSGGVFMKLSGFSSKESISKILNQNIYVSREHVICDYPHEYLWHDLIEKDVVTKDGVVLGKILHVENYKSSDILVIDVHGENKKISVPFIDDYFERRLDFPFEKIISKLKKEELLSFD